MLLIIGITVTYTLVRRNNAIITSPEHNCIPRPVTIRPQPILSKLSACVAIGDNDDTISPYLPTKKTSLRELVVCSNRVGVLQCPTGRLISIRAAYYGRQVPTAGACLERPLDPVMPSFCFNRDTLQRVNTTCSGRRTCALAVSANAYGEPCGPVLKQMLVRYSCEDDKQLAMVNACTLQRTSE